ncbi:hypothetical protein ACWD3J_41900 [Streptomyces sp. NPDC002755]|uniref:hypothetical protein n=1 Tax=Streptomyces sp. NPDC002884 TaxID=3154544 RepID=UPI00331973D7
MTGSQTLDPNADEEVATAPLARLRAAGIRCLTWRDSAGTYIRVPLADGTEVTFSGTAADQGDRPGHDVSTHHPIREHDSWQASLNDADGGCDVLYDSLARGLPYEEDTVALVAAILACAREHGGSDLTSDLDD